MKMDTRQYMPDEREGVWAHSIRKQEPQRTSPLVFLFAGMIAVLLSLMVAHVAFKAVEKAAAYNAGMNGGW